MFVFLAITIQMSDCRRWRIFTYGISSFNFHICTHTISSIFHYKFQFALRHDCVKSSLGLFRCRLQLICPDYVHLSSDFSNFHYSQSQCRKSPSDKKSTHKHKKGDLNFNFGLNTWITHDFDASDKFNVFPLFVFFFLLRSLWWFDFVFYLIWFVWAITFILLPNPKFLLNSQ